MIDHTEDETQWRRYEVIRSRLERGEEDGELTCGCWIVCTEKCSSDKEDYLND